MNPRVLQASMLMERGRYLEAEALLREAITEGDQSALVHAMFGLCLRNAGMHEAANDELKRALAIDPDCAYAHYALSFLTPLTGQRRTPIFLGSCIKHIVRALELAPNDVSYLSRLAGLRQQCHQWKQSLEPIEAALRLAPRNVGLAVQRAETLIHLGRREDARETLLQALATDPDASSVHAGIGWALLRAGDHERAAEFFNEALRLHPELDWAQHGALECAKHQYRIYRLLAYPSRKLIHRPLLRIGTEIGVSVIILLAAFALLFWLDPIIRPRWGGWPVALLIAPLLFLPFALQFGKEPFFSWLVRHHQSAQLSATRPFVAEHATRWVLGIIVACATLMFIALFHYSKSPVAFGLLGLVPGISSLGVTIFDVPSGNVRKWLMIFSAAILIAGPILLIAFREFIIDLNPDPRSIILLCVPAIIMAIVSDRIKQKDRAQRHQQMLAASRKKVIPE
jgi:tetratricopeptide (TPR) repeat protein